MARMMDRLHAFVRSLSEDTGLRVRVHKATYSDYDARIQIDACVVRADGVPMDRDAQAFLEHAPRFGLRPADLGRTFVCGTDTLQIVGLRPRAKLAVLCRLIHAPPSDVPVLYKLSPEHVRRHTGGASAPGRREQWIRVVDSKDSTDPA